MELLQKWFYNDKFTMVLDEPERQIFFDRKEKAFYIVTINELDEVVITQVTQDNISYNEYLKEFKGKTFPEFKNYYLALVDKQDEESAIYESQNVEEIYNLFYSMAVPSHYEWLVLRGTNEPVDTHVDYEVLDAKYN